MMRQMHRWFSILSCLALAFLATPAHQAWADTSDNGSGFGGEDKDDDGLTNDEEAQAGTAFDNADTDGDHVVDGQDGWAGNAKDPASNTVQAKLAPPRIPNTKYAVIDVGPFELGGWRSFDYRGLSGRNIASGASVYLSDSGDMAFAESETTNGFDKKIWRFKAGTLTTIYQRSSPNEEFFLGGIGKDGVVVVTKYTFHPRVTIDENTYRDDYYDGRLQAYTSNGSWVPQARNKTMYNAYDYPTPGLPTGIAVDETVIGMSSSGKMIISSNYDSTYSFHQKSIMTVGEEMTPLDDTDSETHPQGELGFIHRNRSYHCINNEGVIAGSFWKWSDPAGPIVGGVLDQGNLQQLGGSDTTLGSINNLGHIKGYKYSNSSYEGVIYLKKNGSYEEVKTAGLPIQGELNDRMEMAPSPYTWSEDGAYQAKIWQNFQWKNLKDLISNANEWTNFKVQDLNNKGLIAATATKDGNKHLVELVPTDVVTINTFIPMNYVDHPNPFAGSIFEGDNRHGGSPDRATWNERGAHRTHTEFNVVAWQIADSNGLLDNAYANDPDGIKNDEYFVHIGKTQEYDKATSLDASNNISAAAHADTSLNDGNMKIKEGTAPKSEVWIESKEFLSPKKVAITCRCEASNPLVFGSSWGPISYTFVVTIDKTDPAAPKYSLTGSCKSFPAYEVYINGKRVYQYDPMVDGRTPNWLLLPASAITPLIDQPLP